MTPLFSSPQLTYLTLLTLRTKSTTTRGRKSGLPPFHSQNNKASNRQTIKTRKRQTVKPLPHIYTVPTTPLNSSIISPQPTAPTSPPHSSVPPSLQAVLGFPSCSPLRFPLHSLLQSPLHHHPTPQFLLHLHPHHRHHPTLQPTHP